MTQTVTLRSRVPYKYEPRSYQREFWGAMEKLKRAILVWHRRAGKDKTVLNFTISKMLKRVGVYFYFFPTYAQGKKILWDGKDRSGFRFMHHFPGFETPGEEGSLVKQVWQDEMKVELSNGSIFQIIGTDKMDSIVGTNPVGAVFSEYAIQNPKGWDFIRPILRENGGWAVFVYTPRGKNHGYRLWARIQGSERLKKQWYCSMLTIEDTKRDAPGEDGSRVVTKQDVEDDIAEGMSEALAQQEYYCSWEGYLEGAYYGDLIARARADGRIGVFPVNIDEPVDTGWDLGVDDSTAIVFTQNVKGVPRFIDYMESHGHGVPWYVAQLRQRGIGTDKRFDPYVYGIHFAPHDIAVTEWGTGNTRLQTAAKLGLVFEPVPKLKLEDGIDATRKLLAKAVFHEATVDKLIDILSAYRREWDDETQTWNKQPLHDWTSHGADAVRSRAVAYFDPDLSKLTQRFARMRFNALAQDPSEQKEAEMHEWQKKWPQEGRWTTKQDYAEV